MNTDQYANRIYTDISPPFTMSDHSLPDIAAAARPDLDIRFKATEAALLELHNTRSNWRATIRYLEQRVAVTEPGTGGAAAIFLLECERVIFRWAVEVMDWQRRQIELEQANIHREWAASAALGVVVDREQKVQDI